MKNNSSSGFLIALVSPEYRNPRNPAYLGADRIPTWPSNIPEEAKASYDYVFGNYKDSESNLIPTIEKATELFRAFSVSPRRFEILACCSGPDDAILDALGGTPILYLGYDVAGITSDGWSIVDDIPDSDWAKRYVTLLNENGLFRTRQDAERYLQEYRHFKEADYDMSFDVVFVVRLGVE